MLQSSPKEHLLCSETGQVSMEVRYFSRRFRQSFVKPGALHSTKYSATLLLHYLMNNNNNNNNHSETVEHLVAGCQKLANSEYISRHNRVLMILAVAWAKKHGLIGQDVVWYEQR